MNTPAPAAANEVAPRIVQVVIPAYLRKNETPEGRHARAKDPNFRRALKANGWTLRGIARWVISGESLPPVPPVEISAAPIKTIGELAWLSTHVKLLAPGEMTNEGRRNMETARRFNRMPRDVQQHFASLPVSEFRSVSEGRSRGVAPVARPRERRSSTRRTTANARGPDGASGSPSPELPASVHHLLAGLVRAREAIADGDLDYADAILDRLELDWHERRAA